jgi:hypothetical protein
MDEILNNIGCKVILQAVKDYFRKPKSQKAILKDLRSTWMDWLTGGKSLWYADQLEHHPETIRENLRKIEAAEEDAS